MTTDELVEVLDKRGLRVNVRPDGTPELLGGKEMATPTLMRAIKFHREALIRRFAPAFQTVEPVTGVQERVADPPAEEVVEEGPPRWVPHPGMKPESLAYWKAVMEWPLPPAWMMTVPAEDDADENA